MDDSNFSDELPAIIGGTSIFSSLIPIIQPTLPSIDELREEIQEILPTQMITNHKYVQELENRLIDYLGIRYVIGISNCTTGLLLLGRCLDLKGEVITPNFSFSATTLPLVWLHLKPIFVDCDPNKFSINPLNLLEKIKSKTSAILATHIFGNLCNINALKDIAEDHNLKLIFNSVMA